MAGTVEWLRRVAPYPLRVEIARLRHLPRRLLERPSTARRRDPGLTAPFVLARQASPMVRGLSAGAPPLPAGGETDNVRAAAARIDGLVIAPHQLFSFLWTVGRPSRWRGFRRGLELHDQRPTLGVGGGACKVANLIYQLALAGGMRIVERHRHQLDLFPDRERRVPFGLGATVAYNHADLRFENPLVDPVIIRLAIRGGELVGELCTVADPGSLAALIKQNGNVAVALETVMADMGTKDAERLHALIVRHAHYTNSARAQMILADWAAWLPKFKKIMPHEYKRALAKLAGAQLEGRSEGLKAAKA